MGKCAARKEGKQGEERGQEEEEPLPECVEFRKDGKHVESDSVGSNKDIVY